MNRSALERDLSKALSRYIGYTTAAYGLDRIVATLEVFRHAPSAYLHELMEAVVARHEVFSGEVTKNKADSKYLEEIVHFAEAMAIVKAVSTREVRLRRFAPTEQGRALLGAQTSGDRNFVRHFLTMVVLRADADAVFPLLKYFQQPQTESLQVFYLKFQSKLRRERAAWLESAFPERILLDRVVSAVPWLPVLKRADTELRPDDLSSNTARHHTTPRKGWLQTLGLYDGKSQALTEFGKVVHNALLEDKRYFWLGPKEDTQAGLGIPAGVQKPGPFEDTFSLVKVAPAPKGSELNVLVGDVAEVMKAGYVGAKLIHASQATLRLPIEYVHYREYNDQRRYDWKAVISQVFARFRGEFQRLSPKRGQIGFYKWNGRAP